MATQLVPEQIRLTYDEYAKLPNDGLRYEIIEGELFMSPAPEAQARTCADASVQPSESAY